MHYVYNAREHGNLSTEVLEENIYKTKNTEEEIIRSDPKKIWNLTKNLTSFEYI